METGSSEPGWHEGTLEHENLDRVFRFYIPRQITDEATVVVLLHGGTQSMDKLFRSNAGGTQEWKEIADEEGFLLLVPNGTNSDTGSPEGDSQNWNDCRPQELGRTDVDDVGFINALLDWTVNRFADETFSVDIKQTFVSGASNGGMMAYRLATELPDRVAAAAAFIANRPVPTECPDSAPVPMMIVNGTEDRIMPYDGGSIINDRGEVISAEATRDYWISVNQANALNPKITQLTDRDPDDDSVIICEDYSASGSGAMVRFCTVKGGGHTMPSVEHGVILGRQNRDIEGARLAWEFFESVSN